MRKDVYIKKLQQYFSKGEVYSGIMSFPTTRKGYDVIKIINQYEKEIQIAIQTLVDKHDFNNAFNLLAKLRSMGANWNWIDSELISNKSNYIKSILYLLKSGDGGIANFSLVLARNGNIKWEDLNVISRSLNIGFNENLK